MRSSEECSSERRSSSTRAWCRVGADIVNEIAGEVNHAAADESLHVDGGGLGPKATPVAMVDQVTVYMGIGRPGHRRRAPWIGVPPIAAIQTVDSLVGAHKPCPTGRGANIPDGFLFDVTTLGRR